LSKAKKPESSDITVGNSFINAMLYQLIVFENKLLKIFNFPFGVSTFVWLEKNNFLAHTNSNPKAVNSNFIQIKRN
jgi:hypothetical protein